MSHTAAPWLKREMYAGTRRYRIEIYARFEAGRGEHPICQIPGGFTNQDEDAALILAAPDLLSALRGLGVNYPDGEPCFCEMVIDNPLFRRHSGSCRVARAAIRKAEGSHRP